MRLSANPTSPHWKPCALEARVFLDGGELANVVEASEEEGWADVAAVDDDDAIVIDEHHEIKTYRLTGIVRILV